MLLEQEVHLQILPALAAAAGSTESSTANHTGTSSAPAVPAIAAPAVVAVCLLGDHCEQRLVVLRGVLVPRLRWPCRSHHRGRTLLRYTRNASCSMHAHDGGLRQ